MRDQRMAFGQPIDACINGLCRCGRLSTIMISANGKPSLSTKLANAVSPFASLEAFHASAVPTKPETTISALMLVDIFLQEICVSYSRAHR
jgi:hypothetical protein